MPKKRKNTKIVTKESDTLKRMRNAKGISQAKAAELIGVSKTAVNHFENGWDDIPSSYIDRFITKMNFTSKDWSDFYTKKITSFDLKNECVKMIHSVEDKKLKAIHNFLSNFL